jgi:hypothetical protein
MSARKLRGVNRKGRFLTVRPAHKRYGPSTAAWRRWIWKDLLGDAVRRFGRSVRLDSLALDERLRLTGQILDANEADDRS